MILRFPTGGKSVIVYQYIFNGTLSPIILFATWHFNIINFCSRMNITFIQVKLCEYPFLLFCWMFAKSMDKATALAIKNNQKNSLSTHLARVSHSMAILALASMLSRRNLVLRTRRHLLRHIGISASLWMDKVSISISLALLFSFTWFSLTILLFTCALCLVGRMNTLRRINGTFCPESLRR